LIILNIFLPLYFSKIRKGDEKMMPLKRLAINASGLVQSNIFRIEYQLPIDNFVNE
jgi:hypothetical protein